MTPPRNSNAARDIANVLHPYTDAKAFQPQIHYFVGGATKLYGAALYRLRAEDFGELKHHDGVSPAWPIGYDEMEPYYTLAEQRYGEERAGSDSNKNVANPALVRTFLGNVGDLYGLASHRQAADRSFPFRDGRGAQSGHQFIR